MAGTEGSILFMPDDVREIRMPVVNCEAINTKQEGQKLVFIYNKAYFHFILEVTSGLKTQTMHSKTVE